jgi:hypothetical protein
MNSMYGDFLAPSFTPLNSLQHVKKKEELKELETVPCAVCKGDVILGVNSEFKYACNHHAHTLCTGMLKKCQNLYSLIFTCWDCRPKRNTKKIVWQDKDTKINFISRMQLHGFDTLLTKEIFYSPHKPLNVIDLCNKNISFEDILNYGVSLRQIMYQTKEKDPYTYRGLGLNINHFINYPQLMNLNDWLKYCDIDWPKLKDLYPKMTAKTLLKIPNLDFVTMKLLNMNFFLMLHEGMTFREMKRLNLTMKDLVSLGASEDLAYECLEKSLSDICVKTSSSNTKKLNSKIKNK